MNKKIIIDMDIGDDIDDAFALLTAMELNADIIGITTVFGNTNERARITKKLMKLFGKGYENVPVYAGYGTPLAEKDKDHGHLCQYTPDIDTDDFKPDSIVPEEAVDFIIRSCKTYGENLKIIAIGPFTNIARVILKDKFALNRAGEIIIMGGAYYKHYVDWNVLCDVEAAKLMFESVNNIHCLGADVTHQLKISEKEDTRIEFYSGSRSDLKYLSELYRLWKVQSGSIAVLHDPLAIFYSFEHNYVSSECIPVTVIESGYARGITLNIKGYGKAAYNPEYNGFDMSKTHTVAHSVDRERVIFDFIKFFK